jgi:hypothetical protein
VNAASSTSYGGAGEVSGSAAAPHQYQPQCTSLSCSGKLRRRRSLTFGLDRFHLSSSALLESLPDVPEEHAFDQVDTTSDGRVVLLSNLGMLFATKGWQAAGALDV